MREILFATDGSEDAGHACRLLAGLPRSDEGKITVVSVIPTTAAPWLGGIASEEWPSAAAEAAADNAVRQIAEDAARSLRAGGWPARAQVRVGFPAYEILEAARELPADLIVTGSKGLTGVPAFLLGSVSQNVAKHAACSVLVVRGLPESFATVLIAVDGSKAAERAVERLLSFPLPPAAVQSVLHVLEPISPGWDTYLSDVEGAGLRTRVESGRLAAAEHLVERAALRLRARRPAAGRRRDIGRDATPLVVHGRAAEQLLQVVKEQKPDLLVVGARGLNAVEAFLLGSVSGRMLRYAPCSVLIAR